MPTYEFGTRPACIVTVATDLSDDCVELALTAVVARKWQVRHEWKKTYHHKHSDTGATDLDKDVCQALRNVYVTSDHRRKGDSWVQVTTRHISSYVHCIAKL